MNMSNYDEAFVIPVNDQNKNFVANPYIQYPSLVYKEAPLKTDYGMVGVAPQVLSTARIFDIDGGCLTNLNGLSLPTPMTVKTPAFPPLFK